MEEVVYTKTMNLKYPVKKEGDIVGTTLIVTNPLLSTNKRRYFTAKCSLCQEERNYRYDSLKTIKGCPSRCQNKEDFTGLKTKNYTVLHPVKGRESFWQCLCLCGKTFLRKSSAIKKGIVKGCCQKIESPAKTKEGTLNRLLRASYKRSAKRRDLEFSLSQEEFDFFISCPCYYCGIKNSSLYTSSGCIGNLAYNGIDRKDNNIGYVKDNCVTACKDCNYAKHSKTMEHFLAWIERLKNYEQK